MIRLSIYDKDYREIFDALTDEEKYAYFDTLGETYAYIKEAIEGIDPINLVAIIDFI